jgi:DNA-binding FadR family transcriptional regulator
LADTHGVAVNTARSAVALLRDEGWVVVQHGKGTLVRSQPPAGAGESGGDRPDDGNERVWQAIAEIRRRLADVERRLTKDDQG